jgi:hypothetical protein
VTPQAPAVPEGLSPKGEAFKPSLSPDAASTPKAATESKATLSEIH